ncbi:VanZ family protein [Flavivirga aquatica]|uniref:VanZ family protein n=1 Tax=Flavivirga aquatica TaxID=1849968 RepID=UPI0009F7068F|nr:VanZ family protein [Flavivirga aquatica]
MLKKVTLIITLAYSVALSTVSLIRLNNLPDVGVSFGDKIFHFLAYCLLTLLWFSVFLLVFNLKKKKAIYFAVIFAIVFGIVIEVLQDTMTESRALDVYDVVANTMGALLASLVLWFKKKLYIKNF